MLSVLLLAQIASTVPAAQEAGAAPPRQTTLGRVEAAKEPAVALALARALLPAELADRVVEASVRRQWQPGQVWWIGIREAARPTAPDLCQRPAYSLKASAPDAGEDASPSTRMAVEFLGRWQEAAVLPQALPATLESCGQAVGYLPVDYQEERTIAAYRVLLAMMKEARIDRPLPFVLTCEAENASACEDARAALASLPLDVMHAIEITCPLAEQLRRDRFVACPEQTGGQPYRAEARFGMSGSDGHSWNASFVHRPGWPEEIALSRSMVIYH